MNRLMINNENSDIGGEPSALLLVHLPPPIHGMSLVSQAVKEAFCKRLVVDVVDLSYGSLVLRPADAARYLAPIWRSIIKLLSRPSPENQWVYLVLSGGPRQIFELPIIFLAKITGRRVVLHHHSVNYINSPKRLTCLIYNILGPDDVSVFLDESHRAKFQDVYRSRTNNFSISNLAFLKLAFAPRPRKPPIGRPLRLGFLSNIELTKGVDIFVQTVARLHEAGVQVEARIAGPFRDRAAEEVVRSAAAAGLVHYVGPVFGADKQRLLDEIDVLLFPSRYANETEPVAVLECMAAGVPVLATPVGCLPSILGAGNRQLMPAEDFAGQALALITRFRDDPASYESASAAVLARAADRHSGAQVELDAFFRCVAAPWRRR